MNKSCINCPYNGAMQIIPECNPCNNCPNRDSMFRGIGIKTDDINNVDISVDSNLINRLNEYHSVLEMYLEAAKIVQDYNLIPTLNMLIKRYDSLFSNYIDIVNNTQKIDKKG